MYKLLKDAYTDEMAGTVRRTEDGASIPFCADNTDYQQFKVDVEAGAELLDADGNIIDGKEFIKGLP